MSVYCRFMLLIELSQSGISWFIPSNFLRLPDQPLTGNLPVSSIFFLQLFWSGWSVCLLLSWKQRSDRSWNSKPCTILSISLWQDRGIWRHLWYSQFYASVSFTSTSVQQVRLRRFIGKVELELYSYQLLSKAQTWPGNCFIQIIYRLLSKFKA